MNTCKSCQDRQTKNQLCYECSLTEQQKKDIQEVTAMLNGVTDRNKIVNFITEYIYNPYNNK